MPSTRKTKAQWEAEVNNAYQQGRLKGISEGRELAYKEVNGETAKTRLDILRGIGQTIQACAQLADNVGGLR